MDERHCQLDTFASSVLTLPSSLPGVINNNQSQTSYTTLQQLKDAIRNGLNRTFNVLQVGQDSKPFLPVGQGPKPVFPVGQGDKPVLPVGLGDKPVLPVGQGSKPFLPVGQGPKPVFPVGQVPKPVFQVGQGDKPVLPMGQGPKPVFPVGQGDKPDLPVGQGVKPDLPVGQGDKPDLPVGQGDKPDLPLEEGNTLSDLWESPGEKQHGTKSEEEELQKKRRKILSESDRALITVAQDGSFRYSQLTGKLTLILCFLIFVLKHSLFDWEISPVWD
jgi:hypothetical protein